jgi:hypothetical protein
LGKNKNGKGHSGGGSTLEAARDYIDFVQKFIKDHNIKTVIDAGCGDWEFMYHMDLSNIEYIGYDIVKFVIEKNIKKYSTPHISFRHGNIVEIDLPIADLLLCKDVLQHFHEYQTNDLIVAFLPQLKKYKYCLITNAKVFNENILSKLNQAHVIFSYLAASTEYSGEIKTIILVKNF